LVEEFKYRGAIVKIYVRRGHKPETQRTFYADIWFLLPTVESMNENWQVLYHSLPNGLEGQDAVKLSAREAIRAHLDHLLD